MREVMTATEVAELFRVDPRTVSSWCRAGKIRAFRTLGGVGGYGHWRIPADEVSRMWNEQMEEAGILPDLVD